MTIPNISNTLEYYCMSNLTFVARADLVAMHAWPTVWWWDGFVSFYL